MSRLNNRRNSRLSSSSRNSRLQSRGSRRGGGLDFDDSSDLKTFAELQGVTPPEPKKNFSALRALGRILNIGTATVAGAVSGAIDPEKSIVEGVKRGVKENLSFSDVINTNRPVGIYLIAIIR